MERLIWLDEKKEEIIKLYNEGKKQTEIAKYFGVSQGSISTRLRSWGVSNPDGNRFKRVDIDKETLYDMYWNQKMHPVDIGKVFGCSKIAIHQKMKKYNIPCRTKSESRMGKLNPIYNVGHTTETKRKMSDAFVNGKRKSFGFSKNWGKGSYYDTPNQGRVWMRSGWEIKVADYLTENEIDWYYEYRWLKITEDMNYLPDFFIPILNCYVEVKGRKKERDIEKFELARKKHNILLWDGEELLKLGIINNSGSTELNKKYRKDLKTNQDK